MKKPILLVLFFLAIFLKSLSAQQTGTVRGFVTDSTSSEALAYGNVFIKELNAGASTDSRGYFIIPSLPANRNLTLIVSYVGYITKTISIVLPPNKVTQFNIKLVPSSIELQAIEKVGEKVIEKNVTDISLQRIVARDLDALPQSVEADVFRVMQFLPGVQSTGDISAKYYVRGGAGNQNLILFDGMTIYSPFHALGLFGVVDPDVVNNIEFYKGGFSADYGGRLSSVMKIVSKDGNKNNYSGKATVNNLTAKALVEGPLPHGSFILSGRKSYSNSILKKFLSDKHAPIDFYDASFKINYSNPDFIQGGKFLLNTFVSGDNIANNDPTIEDYKWSNRILGFKWFQVGDSPLFYELGLSTSNFSGEVIPKFSPARRTENNVEDIGLAIDFTYMFDNKDEIGVGLHVKQIKTDLTILNDEGTGVNINASNANIVFYAKYKLMQLDFLGIDAGARINLTSLSQNPALKLVEPRFSFSLNLIPQIRIKGAWGIYQQEMTTISDENDIINIFDPWVIMPVYLKPQLSNHYILGLELIPAEDVSLNIETYYKEIKNMPLLNQQKTLATEPDFIACDGESYGVEAMLKVKVEPFTFVGSFTHAYAYRELDERRYYQKFDIRNTLNLSLEANLGWGITANLVWFYNSGNPFTQLSGFYDKYYFDNFLTPWTAADPRRPYGILAIQNLGRLPDYHRLDFKLSKKFEFYFLKLDADLSFINLYNRKNIFYFKRETGEVVNMLPFLPNLTLKVEI